ncbi:hypothetical protein GCM10008927_19830 [Amylibacter ulvae]|uniref:DUF1223 domain-containing protein n=1 Tax=Paramylibacter ulvae TaxID=1651968 RepID=A0ABQ3D2Z6_9RHOB|nr:DUF1223 domain-containing protein [Amylibacter ulvae]GHA53951.1 hypothetical protein GCM10008927_19830 [Amylibacter ulvae]
MRILFTSLSLVCFGMGAAQADQKMVVLELYTSQGCSSCPPADKILTELSKHDDVIGLGVHVDYWDYLGWKDKFAQAKFSKRQAQYNSALQTRYRLVTPQMIVHGVGQVAGGTGKSPALIKDYIAKARALQERATLDIARNNKTLTVKVDTAGAPVGRSRIQLVYFKPMERVKIGHGENGGRTIDYTNVVSQWDTIAQWNGSTPLNLTYDLERDEPVAVFVQGEKLGPILAARKLP